MAGRVFMLGLMATSHCSALTSETVSAEVDYTASQVLLTNRVTSQHSSMYHRLGHFCQKHFFLTLETCIKPLDDNTTFVVTGDIDAMWIRDSAAQLHPYIALAQAEERAGRQSLLRPILEGTLRRQAQFIRTDPYANAFTMEWDSAKDERLARGAYTFTGNYELDDGPYFFRFMAHLADAFPKSAVLHETPVQEATRMLLALYKQEQQHAYGKSLYRYPKSPPYELGGPDGQGQPVGYTGMVWGAFRPSDDAQEFGYNVPANVFLATTLKKVEDIARTLWEDAGLASSAARLRKEILQGVHEFATSVRPNGETVYCYEVDGLGNCSIMDDANVPSLLSLPYLDPSASSYDKKIYKATRKLILSKENPWYFEGSSAKGIGSPHTGRDKVWPMSLVMQAMTADSLEEESSVLSVLEGLKVLENGLTESFDVNDPSRITRPWFGWPNSLFGEHMMSKRGCTPDINKIASKIPETKPTEIEPQIAMIASSQQPDGTSNSFYNMDPVFLRRPGVTLPDEEFYPQRHLLKRHEH